MTFPQTITKRIRKKNILVSFQVRGPASTEKQRTTGTLSCNGEPCLEEALAASGDVAVVMGSEFQSPSLASSPPEYKIPLFWSQNVLLTISLCPPFKIWQSWRESALTCRTLMLPLLNMWRNERLDGRISLKTCLLGRKRRLVR
jgi:hypothetical protein